MNPSMVDANREFRAAMELASILGLQGNGSIDYASEATKQLVGLDVKSFGINPKSNGPIHLGRISFGTSCVKRPEKITFSPGRNTGPGYTPTKLASMIGNGLDARKVNKLLLELGLQEPVKIAPYRTRKTQLTVGYVPTDKGLEHAVQSDHGFSRSQWKWMISVLPHLVKAAI